MHSRVVVQVGAGWCGPCKVLKPIAEEVCAKEGVVYQYVDVESEEGMKIIEDNNFRSIPVLRYSKVINVDGQEQDEVRYKVGGFDYEGVVSFIKDMV